jgi:hypothetical protein
MYLELAINFLKVIYLSLLKVADLEYFDADPDPTFHFGSDLDQLFLIFLLLKS